MTLATLLLVMTTMYWSTVVVSLSPATSEDPIRQFVSSVQPFIKSSDRIVKAKDNE
jgi:hypothetical protein